MSRPRDARDITDLVTATGWTLPPRWRVYAWTEPDDIGDPRQKGDVYNTDAEEADYSNPTRGFCKHCGAWIRTVSAEELRAALPMATGTDTDTGINGHPHEVGGTGGEIGEVAGGVLVGVPGTELTGTGHTFTGPVWRAAPDGPIVCPASPDCSGRGPHELDEPLAVRWWRQDRWMFVTVVVQVEDPDGREWGTATLGAVEMGTFPVGIDYTTGEVTSREIDPITEDYPVPELITDALQDARDAVRSHDAAGPQVEPPAITGAPADDT